MFFHPAASTSPMCITALWHDYCNLRVTKSETYENNNYGECLRNPVVLSFVTVGFTLLIFSFLASGEVPAEELLRQMDLFMQEKSLCISENHKGFGKIPLG